MNLAPVPENQGVLTPTNMGLFFSVPISSTAGSPGLSYRQPLIAGHIFSSAGVLIGAEVFLLLAKYLFKLESIPVLDLPNQQIIKMPVPEFQELFTTFYVKTTGHTPSSLTSNVPFNRQTSANIPGTRGFISPLPPEAPLVISLYVTSNFSNQLYSPNVWILVPILVFPGLRGVLPMLILTLLATIFIRTVVAPETTGAKPMPKQGERPNSSLNFSPEELFRFLSRFGKYFSSH